MKEYEIKDTNHYVVCGWMINKLNLSGNDLNTFAIIYGFSQKAGNYYFGSISYLSDFLNVSRPTAYNCITNLILSEYIVREEITIPSGVIEGYRVNLDFINNIINNDCSNIIDKSELTDKLKPLLSKLPSDNEDDICKEIITLVKKFYSGKTVIKCKEILQVCKESLPYNKYINNNTFNIQLTNIYNNIQNKNIKSSANTSETSSSDVDTNSYNIPSNNSNKDTKTSYCGEKFSEEKMCDIKSFRDINAPTRADVNSLNTSKQVLFQQKPKSISKNDNILIAHKKRIDTCNFSEKLKKSLYDWVESLIEAKKVITTVQLNIALEKAIKLNVDVGETKLIEIIKDATLSNYTNFDWVKPKQNYNNSGNPYASAKRTFDLPPHKNNDIEELPGETRSEAVKRYKAELLAQGCKEY